jgi:L-amino acid N-acyltransferase YncA
LTWNFNILKLLASEEGGRQNRRTKDKDQKMLTIRRANPKDLDAITEIYNEAILKTSATFDTQPKTSEEQKIWFADHGPKYPVLVAEEGGMVVGWASLSRWSDRCAYSDTAEISLYVGEEHQGKGTGKRLLKAILLEGQKAGLHTIVARITEGSQASIHLHKSMGFTHVGILREVGRKFGRLLDVHLMQKIFESTGVSTDPVQTERET